MNTPVLPATQAAGLRRLTHVSRALAYAASLADVLRLTVDSAVDLLGGDRAILALTDDARLLRIHAAHGIPADIVSAFRSSLDDASARRLDTLFGIGAERRVLATPLVVDGRTIGLLAVDRGRDTPADEQEEWLLSALADHAALAVQAREGAEARGTLELQLRQLENVRARTEHALRIASHDLRTPLGAMQGYLELLASGVFGPLSERQNEILERVRIAGDHLRSVLETILEFARLDTIDPHATPPDIHSGPVIAEAVNLIMPAADRKHIRIAVETAHAPRVRAHPDWLRQMTIHLLDNAVKYSPPRTTVRVSATTEEADGERWCAIVVSDQGPGVPRSEAEQIFLPTRRATSEGDDPGGSGLGLWIARILARRMHGTIRLDPPATGGSTFRIHLPLASPAATPDRS